jgi:hypothetical protein
MMAAMGWPQPGPQAGPLVLGTAGLARQGGITGTHPEPGEAHAATTVSGSQALEALAAASARLDAEAAARQPTDDDASFE